MLGLRHDTPATFVERFEADLELMLLDHAHCEKKAAATALSLISRYPDNPQLVATLAEIVEEEMSHFRMVLDIMSARGWAFRGARGSAYAGALHTQVRKPYAEGFIDRMIIAALIEARSCERFALLGEHVSDLELRAFYKSLFESEARHYGTYIKLALQAGDEPAVRRRLDELLDFEAKVVAESRPTPHLHA